MTEHEEQDLRLLRAAVALGDRCPPSPSAFSVGAVVAAADGTVLATGHSRAHDPTEHAEEAALDELAPDDPRLHAATIYTSLEPCGSRASRPRSCATRISDAGIQRIVYAWREPRLLAAGGGGDLLRAAGRTVLEIPWLAEPVRQTNAHIPGVYPAADE